MNKYLKASISATIGLFVMAASASAQFWSLSGNSVGASDFVGTTNSNPFRISTNSTERLRIDGSGNVGIGITSPGRRLNLYTNSPQLRLSDGSGSWDMWAGYDFIIRTGGSSTEWLRFDSAARAIYIGPNDELYVNINTGNVGLGTTTPNNRLTINGSIVPYLDCSYTFGRSGRRWNTVYAANGTINTSDARLKENIRDLGYGLDEIMKLRPVSFTWKDDKDYGTKLGLLAQEVQPVIPEVVKTGEEGNMGLCYDELLPVLVKGVQQQQGMISAEIAEHDRLRKELAAQEQRIAELEHALNITD